MPATYSPLRYPGGKTKFYTYVKELLECNNLIGETYMEPFAGGAENNRNTDCQLPEYHFCCSDFVESYNSTPTSVIFIFYT